MRADPHSLFLLQLTGEGEGQPQPQQSYLGAILTEEGAQSELHAAHPEADRDVDEALAWKEYFERTRSDSIARAQSVWGPAGVRVAGSLSAWQRVPALGPHQVQPCSH